MLWQQAGVQMMQLLQPANLKNKFDYLYQRGEFNATPKYSAKNIRKIYQRDMFLEQPAVSCDNLTTLERQTIEHIKWC